MASGPYKQYIYGYTDDDGNVLLTTQLPELPTLLHHVSFVEFDWDMLLVEWCHLLITELKLHCQMHLFLK